MILRKIDEWPINWPRLVQYPSPISQDYLLIAINALKKLFNVQTKLAIAKLLTLSLTTC